MTPLAVVTAVVMLAAWFPLAALWHQQSQIDATTSQISALRLQERTLAARAKSISTRAAATLLARQQYQLVLPGQSFIQVLPGREAGSPSVASGDPGLQPLVSPSSVTALGSTPTVHRRSAVGGFVSRLVRTLEFWR